MTIDEIIDYCKQSITDAERDRKTCLSYFDGKIVAYNIILLLLENRNEVR